MHIPDGYLGPATCIVFFVVMFVIWFFAFKSANKNLGPRTVPMLAFMAALSFLLMMFNLPIPDGTTAHMVGAVLIAIVLGPYGATVALTIALLIQALLFGDGGITAFGANVFNMGVVMPFVGILIYTGVRKALGNKTRSRTIGAFVGGYIGINIAALCAAIEFGIQPIIAPGYCPYGLDVAIPAMVSAHLLVGIVEGLATAAVVYYLCEYRPDLMNLPKMAPRWMEKMLADDVPLKSIDKPGDKQPIDAKGGS